MITGPSLRAKSRRSPIELDAMKAKRAELEGNRRRSEGEVERLDEEFRAAGGRHWESRRDRERRQEELKREIADCESRLATLAGTELPLCLVSDLLERVKHQDERERVASETEAVHRILAERDDQLLSLLAESKAPATIVRKVKQHLADDRESRSLTAEETVSRLVAHDRCPVDASPVAKPAIV